MGINVEMNNQLAEMDEKYGDCMYKLFGPTLLGYPEDCDSSRLYMLTSHLKQCLVLRNPDVARIQPGYDNVIGRYNHAYKDMPGEWEVKDVINKFSNHPGAMYTVVLYNRKTDTYDMVEKAVAESLTEKFGYTYDTSFMDNLKPGDKIKDAVLYKSTSYDEHMNYRFGKNAKVFLSISNDTLDDAMLIRKGWAEGVESTEVDIVEVPINDNDVLLNLHGDEEDYRPVPKIGEVIQHTAICATRRIDKKHIHFDFQSPNMRVIAPTDFDYYVPKNSVVYDVDVWYNGDTEFPDNAFFHQLKEYYEDGCEYQRRIYEWSYNIKHSGSQYTKNVTFMKSEAQHYNDKEYPWKSKSGKAFSRMIVRFKVISIVPLAVGSKLTGRYGNKGVARPFVKDVADCVADGILSQDGGELDPSIREKLAKNAQVVDDSRMPYTDDFPVDICLNMSGAVRRLNFGQVPEIEINFIGRCVWKKIKEAETRKEKEDLIFRFLKSVHTVNFDFHWSRYSAFDRYEKVDGIDIHLISERSMDEFIANVEEHGFYLIKPLDADIRYEAVCRMYDEFPFAKPLPMYINIFGTVRRRCIKDGIVGDMYMMILKQNTNKNYSARSTFRVNKAGLPAKDSSKKTNRAFYAKTPVRLSEIYNLWSGVSGRLIAEYNLYMRSSVMARKSMEMILESTGNPLEIKRLPMKHSFINANAEIINCDLKAIGLALEFNKSTDERDDIIQDIPMSMSFGRYTIYDSMIRKGIYARLFYEFNRYIHDKSFVQSYQGEREDIAWKYVFELPVIKEMEVTDDIKAAVQEATKAIYYVPEKKTTHRGHASEDEPDETETDDEVSEKPIRIRRTRKKKTDE